RCPLDPQKQTSLRSKSTIGALSAGVICRRGRAYAGEASSMIGRLSGVRMSIPVILDNKEPDAPSVFEPTALLREARRQKGLSLAEVPALCVLDPDGDIVRRLRNSGQAMLSDKWPCYHTDLYEFTLAGKRRHHWVCRRSAVCGFGCRRTVRMWLSRVDQHYFCRPDQCCGHSTLFCGDRPRIARRRHQLSLRGTGGLCGGGSSDRERRHERASGQGIASLRRRELDDRCTFPRNCERHRRVPRKGHISRRNGGCRSVHLRAQT